MHDGESHVAPREGERGHDLADAAPFGTRRAEKRLARGRVEEEARDGDRGAAPASRVAHIVQLAADHADDGAGTIGGRGLDLQLRHRGDCGERLTAKAEAAHANEITGCPDLRRRVAREGEHGVVPLHPTAVIGDTDARATAIVNGDVDGRGARIE